jgi:hypothetical protein
VRSELIEIEIEGLFRDIGTSPRFGRVCERSGLDPTHIVSAADYLAALASSQRALVLPSSVK